MDFRFFKAQPEPQANVQFPAPPVDDQEPDFVLIALERTNDPDANNHTGFDFFGAYGSGAAITPGALGSPSRLWQKLHCQTRSPSTPPPSTRPDP
jgi:hypothetical protein